MKTFTYTSHNSEETMDFASELANKLKSYFNDEEYYIYRIEADKFAATAIGKSAALDGMRELFAKFSELEHIKKFGCMKTLQKAFDTRLKDLASLPDWNK